MGRVWVTLAIFYRVKGRASRKTSRWRGRQGVVGRFNLVNLDASSVVTKIRQVGGRKLVALDASRDLKAGVKRLVTVVTTEKSQIVTKIPRLHLSFRPIVEVTAENTLPDIQVAPNSRRSSVRGAIDASRGGIFGPFSVTAL